ncbi:na+ antiporter [Salinarchaeum sp. Harcht-Bsk1]|uniref:cation:proton antiporter n=1 Tax=Salinarchaeum sp. Harcht-Bsk1 TaxID=1333523 RepID=UPI0003422C84|nr:cation:proton antiporter [Salinarchaeum sp. Harcht-Bsk1]AGN00765.1 na+ antiporter [Salinarchaeum sp. Harcht-Bsk1]
MAPGAVDVAILVDLIDVFIIAAAVGIFVAKVGDFPYTIALLLAGIAASVIGIEVAIELSHDLILLVLLPPLLFEGAATTDFERLRRNLLPILSLAVVGLVGSIVLLGAAGQYVFGFDLLLALLFAAMILPTDPVSVLALFEDLGAPDRLAVLVEGESLINDGVGVVLFSALLARVSAEAAGDATGPALTTLDGLGDVGLNVLVVSGGGLLVGLAAGFATYSVMRGLDDHMTEIVLTIVLAYGAFVLAEHYFHVSGVIATVVAGLFIGNRGAEYAMSPQTKIAIFTTWETGAFIVNTFIFLMIGVTVPISSVVEHGWAILLAIPLVLLARAVMVYPIIATTNRATRPSVPLAYQHVWVWGGLHGSIPIALVLGLPPGTPEREMLRAMVFGVAAFSLVVQGLTMGPLLDSLGVVTRSDAEELFELLIGRARAVDAALEAAEDLNERGDIPQQAYEEFTAEYEREKAALAGAIRELLAETPELRHEQILAGERRLLQREKSALIDAARSGVVADDVGERLLEEVDLKLDYVHDGQSTVASDEEAFEEFWRQRADEYGLDVDRQHLDDAGTEDTPGSESAGE